MRLRRACFFAALAVSLCMTRAAQPVLDHFFPIVLKPGTTNNVTAVGKFDPWPAQFWCEDSRLGISTQTNTGALQIVVPADAENGPRLVRAYNPLGSGMPRLVMVDAADQALEQEPNDDAAHAQPVPAMPFRLQGRLEKGGDVDCFAIKMERGRTLVAAVQAYTLSSPIDAVLRLVDERGTQLALNHDDGRTLDPRLVWTATRSGTVILQVFGFAYPADSSVRFTGDARCVYRLVATDTAWVNHTIPLGVRRDSLPSLSPVGWNLAEPASAVQMSEDQVRWIGETSVALRFPGVVNEISVPVGSGPEWIEQAKDRPLFETPFAITGSIGSPGEQDRCDFKAKKGETWVIAVQSSTLGFPLDAWISVQDAMSKELARNDDAGGPDPRLEWTAPEDGTFSVVIGNVLRRGGPDHLYRLSVEPAKPALELLAGEHQLVVEAGKTNALKIKASRLLGFTNKVVLALSGTLAGVRADPVEVPEKSGEVELRWVAAADAAARGEPMRIEGTDAVTGKVHPVRFKFTTTGENNGVPNGFHTLLVESTRHLWLTVTRPSTNQAGATTEKK